LIKLLLSGKQLLLFMIIAWSLLIYVGYNVLTVEAAAVVEDKKAELKKICTGFDGGDWDDDSNKCKFSKQAIKDEMMPSLTTT
jgi:hypothetical protein